MTDPEGALGPLRRHPVVGLAALAATVAAVLLVVSIDRQPALPAAGAQSGAAGSATAPLTGEPVPDPEVAGRPVVGVKVENSEASRPQSGLDQADIVFEEIVEGGITRFLALFQSQVPPRVGPVRSARPEDATVFPAFRGVLFLSGAREEVLRDLTDAGIVWRSDDAGSPVFYRSPQRRSPHDLFARGRDLFDVAGPLVGPAEPVAWPFDETPPAGWEPCPEPCRSDPGARISVAMSDVAHTAFTYAPTLGRYHREQNGTPQRVTGDGEVSAANVVVLGMSVGDGGCCDASGARYTATEVLGSGPMVLMRDGRRFTGMWVKAGGGVQFRFLDRAGEPVRLKPGPTWILMAPTGSVPRATP